MPGADERKGEQYRILSFPGKFLHSLGDIRDVCIIADKILIVASLRISRIEISGKETFSQKLYNSHEQKKMHVRNGKVI